MLEDAFYSIRKLVIRRLFALVQYVHGSVSESCCVLISISQFEDDLDDLIPSFDRSGSNTNSDPMFLIVFDDVLVSATKNMKNYSIFLNIIFV